MTKAPTTDLPLHEEKDRPLVVFFVRHAQAEAKKVESELGPPLTALGHEQADHIAARLAHEKFNHAYTSTLQRAHDTARAILKHHPGLVCTPTADLREVASSHFLGEGSATGPREMEALQHERDAILRFTNRLRHIHEPGARVLVVSHGNIMRSLIPTLGGRDPKMSVLLDFNNASLSIVEVWTSGHAVLRLSNCTKHLAHNQIS